MIYKIKSYDSKFIQEAYDEAINKLNEFWGMNWTKNTPDLYIVESRSDINKILGEETENWLVGWAPDIAPEKKDIYLLDFDKLETESDHKKDEAAYKALIAHELCHLFVSDIEKKSFPVGPMWWNEGISTYLSGQLKFKRRPEKFTEFIDSKRENPTSAYNEGGFVIELLVKKYGKEKLIEMVKSLRKSESEGDFRKIFEKVFELELSSEKINKLYLES